MNFSSLTAVMTALQQITYLRTDLFIMFLTVAVLTPLTYTAYLGQPAVRFYCTTVNAHGVAWSVDGLIRHGNELEARGIKTMTNHLLLESNLTISSALENNNTHIRCLAQYLVEHRFITSEEVIFYVQGQLVQTHCCSSVMVEQLLFYSLFYRCTGEVSQPPNHFIWKLPQTSHMECSINPQHNCSGARYIQLSCVQKHQY